MRDVETRVLGKPAGVQDYYPAFAGALHCLWFETGRTVAERLDVEPSDWEEHLTLFDTGAAHSSGMNNWEVFRRRLEGDAAVAASLDRIAAAARKMADAAHRNDFPAMGRALEEEWAAALAGAGRHVPRDRTRDRRRPRPGRGEGSLRAGGVGACLPGPPKNARVREALGRLREVGSARPGGEAGLEASLVA